jgi:toxin ParE1/3/4
MSSRPAKPSRLREAALADIDDAIDYYLLEAPHMVPAFEKAVLRARAHVEKQPGTGSPRYNSPESTGTMRFWLLGQFPYAIFYFERDDYIEIIRVLHQVGNIPAHLQSQF